MPCCKNLFIGLCVCLVLSLLALPAATQVTQIVNGGFESGDLSGWTALGSQVAVGTGITIPNPLVNTGPYSGKYRCVMATQGATPATAASIEQFLSLEPGALTDLGNGIAREGAAIRQTIQAHGGQVISFWYRFGSEEWLRSVMGKKPKNDFLFVSLFRKPEEVTDVRHAPYRTILIQRLMLATFWQQHQIMIPNPGEYNLGIGVMDARDGAVLTGVLIDEVKTTMPEFDSDKNVGFPPVAPHMFAYANAQQQNWWIGDGLNTRFYGRKACYEFWDPKSYYDKNNTYRVAMNGVEIKEFVTLYQPDPECSYTHLRFVDGSHSFEQEAWDNAVDGDTYGYNGTASVTADETGRPWAIFEFTDQKIHKITKIRMMNDTGVGNLKRHVRIFNVSVSTSGMNMGDFTMVLQAVKPNDRTTSQFNDDWMEWEIPPTDAKYVKLVIEWPLQYWRQLGEFEVYEQTVLPSKVKSKLEVTGTPKADGVDAAEILLTLLDADGNPLTGKTEAHDIGIYSVGDACGGHDIFGPIVETGTPGVYKTTLTSTKPGTKKIRAVVNGVIIGDAFVTILNPLPVAEPPTPPDNKLYFVKGSYAHWGEGWDNAVDGDLEGWDGTTTAYGDGDPKNPAWAIFRFGDDFLYRFNIIAIQTDNGTDDDGVEKRQATEIEVQVSETGMDEADFRTVRRIYRDSGEMQYTYMGGYANAKYVKLILHKSNDLNGLRQIVEFGVHTPTRQGAEVVPAVEETDVVAAPETFELEQNYPNPFNPETSISYTLTGDIHVTLRIYDTNGREVTTLVDEYQSAGVHDVTWNATNMPSGLYFYRLSAGDFQAMKRMALVK